MSYWIDANVLIQAKNKAYPFKRFPEFWTFLAVQFEAKTIRSSEFIYKELTPRDDELSQWCKSRRDTAMNTPALQDVQKCYNRITDFIESLPLAKHNVVRKSEFYASADGWVIAHAMAEPNGIVVTHETERDAGKIKIPLVCKEMGIKWIDIYELQDLLDFNPSDYASK